MRMPLHHCCIALISAQTCTLSHASQPVRSPEPRQSTGRVRAAGKHFVEPCCLGSPQS